MQHINNMATGSYFHIAKMICTQYAVLFDGAGQNEYTATIVKRMSTHRMNKEVKSGQK